MRWKIFCVEHDLFNFHTLHQLCVLVDTEIVAMVFGIKRISKINSFVDALLELQNFPSLSVAVNIINFKVNVNKNLRELHKHF